jgi:hypothetical protein
MKKTKKTTKSVIQTKMDFEEVDHVFGALLSAFHPEEIGEDGPDPQFRALWTLFLTCSGWSEDEYWEQVDLLNEGDNEEVFSEKN